MSIAEKLTTIAQNQQRVYDSGKEAEWNTLWDAIQRGGSIPAEVTGLFYGSVWNDNTFKPKHNIVTKTAVQYMFMNSQITDLKGILESRGLILDTSAGNNFYSTFQGSTITRIPVLNMANATNVTSTFYNCKQLVSIEKMIVSNSVTFKNAFYNCSSLEELIIDGVIGQSGFNVSYSTKLTHASLMSIINALETKTSGTWTVTLGTTNLAKLTDAEKAIATEKGWTLA